MTSVTNGAGDAAEAPAERTERRRGAGLLPRRARPGEPNRRLARRVWVHEVAVGVTALRAELAAAERREIEVTERLSAAELAAVSDGVDSLLRRAEAAAEGRNPKHNRFFSWWHGSGVEAAFQNLHRAEAEIVRLYDDAQVCGVIPEAVARIQAGLDVNDPRYEAAMALRDMPPGRFRRVVLGKTIQIGHELKDQQFTKIRKFRNIVIVTGFLIATFTAIFAATVSWYPAGVPFCFGAGPTQSCATGEPVPSWRDVWIVALLGLLGGSLAAAVSVRNIRGTPSPYNLAFALAFLKVPSGALTALGALVVLAGGFVPGFTALDTPAQILAYALVFGYAQQLLTGLIDKRALTLVASVPHKDVEMSRRNHNASVPA